MHRVIMGILTKVSEEPTGSIVGSSDTWVNVFNITRRVNPVDSHQINI